MVNIQHYHIADKSYASQAYGIEVKAFYWLNISNSISVVV